MENARTAFHGTYYAIEPTFDSLILVLLIHPKVHPWEIDLPFYCNYAYLRMKYIPMPNTSDIQNEK